MPSAPDLEDSNELFFKSKFHDTPAMIMYHHTKIWMLAVTLACDKQSSPVFPPDILAYDDLSPK